MSSSEIRVMAIIAVMFLAMCYFMYLKWRYTKDARGYVLALIRNKAGRWRFEKMKIEDGLVELPPVKPGQAGKTFTVDSESAPDVDYPVNKWSFLQTTIPLVVFDEGNWDPLSNVSGRPVMSPGLLYVIRHEAWSAHGIRFAHEVEQKAEQASGTAKKKFNWNIVIIVMVVLALAAALFFGYNELQSLKAATGT